MAPPPLGEGASGPSGKGCSFSFLVVFIHIQGDQEVKTPMFLCDGCVTKAGQKSKKFRNVFGGVLK